jgi:hypothetical protein
MEAPDFSVSCCILCRDYDICKLSTNDTDEICDFYSRKYERLATIITVGDAIALLKNDNYAK